MTSDYGPPSEVVAARLKEVRQRRGMTAAQLAERCGQVGAAGITTQVIANIETGRRDPQTGQRRRHVTVDELLALARALNVAPIHLLVPLEEGAYRVTQHGGIAKVGVVREWIRGNEPYPRTDRREFYSEVPEHEWQAPSAEWSEDTRRQFADFLRKAEQAGLIKGDDDGGS